MKVRYHDFIISTNLISFPLIDEQMTTFPKHCLSFVA